MDSLVATFTRTWQRPPTEAELKGLVDDYVREELAAREAAALGLDRDDTVIRRRLRQKLEFLAEDSVDAAPVTDADLQAFLDGHPERFRVEPEVAFRQVFVSTDRRGEAAERDAIALRARLTASGRNVPRDAGDPSMLPADVERSPQTAIAREFGDGFAAEVVKIEPGQWAGPLRSGYGLHLVWVDTREAERRPTLAEVRPLVERELVSARRQQKMDAMYEGMLARYRVVVERRPTDPQGGRAATVAAPPAPR